MDEETVKAIADAPKDTERTDIFLWANNLVPIKEELEIDLFLFNKNFVVYRTKVSKDLVKSYQPLLIDGLLETVLQGAAEGMTVRDFEDGEAEENVLQRTQLKNVQKAQELLNWVKTQESVIETFVEEDHDLKRVKGILARCTHKDLPWPFYVIKLLPGSMVMKGQTSWMLRNGKFVPFDAEGSLRFPGDNQLLVLDQDIYAFSQTRLEQLFGYNAKKYSIALRKIKEIQAQFTFHFDVGLSWENLIQGQKSLVNKLQKIDPTGVEQNSLMDHAEELGVNLMTDNDGAIIIMDVKDLTKFVNLLNDDYVESPMTGRRYEIKNKKPLRVTENSEEEVV